MSNQSKLPRFLGVAIVLGIVACVAAIVMMIRSVPAEQPVPPKPTLQTFDLPGIQNVLDLCFVGEDRIAFSIHRKVQFFDLQTGSFESSVDVDRPGYDLRTAVSNSQLVVGDALESVIIDTETRETITVFEFGLLPFLIYDDWLLVGDTGNGMLAWDLEDYEYLQVYESLGVAKDSCDPDVDKVVVVGDQTGTRIYDAQDFRLLEVAFLNDKLDFRQRVKVDGVPIVARSTEDRSKIEIVGYQSKKILWTYKKNSSDTASKSGAINLPAEFSPNGQFFAISIRSEQSNEQAAIELRDAMKGTPVGTLGPLPGLPIAMVWTADSKSLAVVVSQAGTDSKLLVFNVDAYLKQ